MDKSAGQRRRDFGVWIRTGRWPLPGDRRGHEVKFNPWHDPRNGRFTFSGAGKYYGPGGQGASRAQDQRTPRIIFPEDPTKRRLNTPEEVDAWAAALLREHGNERGFPEAIEVQRQIYLRNLEPRAPKPSPSPPSGALDKVLDFTAGFGEGVVDTGTASARGLYSLATTNPATTVQNIGLGIAKAVDGAIAAEDTPAHVQIKRAVRAAADASAHDLGHTFGAVTGNIALSMAPGAAVSKISAASRTAGASAILARKTSQAKRAAVGPTGRSPAPDAPALSAPSIADEVRHASIGSSKVALASARRAMVIPRASTAARFGQAEAITATKTPPQVTWVNESQGFKGVAKDYNDSAVGAHSDVATRQARVPAIERTLPDGKKRTVRFVGSTVNF